MYKLFVGGISQDTTEADLKDYFSRFGIISSFVIVQDKNLKISKGYGFITCENKKTYQRILDIKHHEINGRKLDINKALGKNTEVPVDIKSKGLRKLFVGGLQQSTTKEDLATYFSQFGTVSNAYLIYDPQSKLSKNFGYVEFEDVHTAELVLSLPAHEINGKKITLENHRNGLNAALNFTIRETKSKKTAGFTPNEYNGKFGTAVHSCQGSAPNYAHHAAMMEVESGSKYATQRGQCMSPHCVPNLHFPAASFSLVNSSSTKARAEEDFAVPRKLPMLATSLKWLLIGFQQHVNSLERRADWVSHCSTVDTYSFRPRKPRY